VTMKTVNKLDLIMFKGKRFIWRLNDMMWFGYPYSLGGPTMTGGPDELDSPIDEPKLQGWPVDKNGDKIKFSLRSCIEIIENMEAAGHLQLNNRDFTINLLKVRFDKISRLGAQARSEEIELKRMWDRLIHKKTGEPNAV